jgi:hypothetical protein
MHSAEATMFTGFIILLTCFSGSEKARGPNKRGVRTPDPTRLAMHGEEEEKALTGPNLTEPHLTSPVVMLIMSLWLAMRFKLYEGFAQWANHLN